MDEIRKMYIEACKEVDELKAKIEASDDEIEIGCLSLELHSAEFSKRMIAESLELMATL
jgi:hypothetical protein